MTDTGNDHQNNCLMCAVRALTEGTPPTWIWNNPGDSVSGVVLSMGLTHQRVVGSVPYVDIWKGGRERVRVIAHSSAFRAALDSVAAQIGDTLTVRFDGEDVIQVGRFQGKPYKKFSASVQRGHKEGI